MRRYSETNPTRLAVPYRGLQKQVDLNWRPFRGKNKMTIQGKTLLHGHFLIYFIPSRAPGASACVLSTPRGVYNLYPLQSFPALSLRKRGQIEFLFHFRFLFLQHPGTAPRGSCAWRSWRHRRLPRRNDRGKQRSQCVNQFDSLFHLQLPQSVLTRTWQSVSRHWFRFTKGNGRNFLQGQYFAVNFISVKLIFWIIAENSYVFNPYSSKAAFWICF